MASVYPLSLIELLDGSEIMRALSEKNALKVGDVLSGRVVKLINQGEALIDFGRFRARALVSIPLTEGERLHVSVLETGEKIRFQVQVPEKNVSMDILARSGFLERNQWIDLPRSADFIAGLSARLSDNVPLTGPNTSPVVAPEQGMPQYPLNTQQILATVPHEPTAQSILSTLTHMKNLLGALDLHDDPQAIGARMHSLIRSSGLFWENTLVNLASSLGQGESRTGEGEAIDWNALVRQLQESAKVDFKQQIKSLVEQVKVASSQDKPLAFDKERLSTVRRELDTFIDSMLTQHRQIFEEIQLRQENQTVFSFNLPFEQANVNGKIKLYLKKGKSKNRNNGWRISLLLNLTRLGGVRVDFYYLPQVLRLTVFVLDRFLQNELMTQAQALIDRLRGIIETVHFEVLVSKAKIDHFEAEDWAEDKSEGQLSVDIKA